MGACKKEVKLAVQKAGIMAAIELSELGRESGKKSLCESAAKVADATATGDVKKFLTVY